MPDPHAVPLQLSLRGAADGTGTRAEPRLAAPATIEGNRLVERTVERTVEPAVEWETARSAAAATQKAAARASVERVEAREEPSPELVRLLAHLRATVARYVRERREAGLPVERVLPEVKALVRNASALEAWFDPADTLMAQVVHWTITAFYDEPELAHGGRGAGRRRRGALALHTDGRAPAGPPLQ